MEVWRLKKDSEKRVRTGHPWFFASEFVNSTREITPGSLVEVQDHRGHFVGSGYASPKSQIAVRLLTRNAKERDLESVEFFIQRLRAALELRHQLGWSEHSHRWVYAEGDDLPGLVIDRFINPEGEAVVIQTSTVGMDRRLDLICQAIRNVLPGVRVALLAANTSRARPLEGLGIEQRRLIGVGGAGNGEGSMRESELIAPGVDSLGFNSRGMSMALDSWRINLRSGAYVKASLLNGQKTGFFLDQQAHVCKLIEFINQRSHKRIRVLDLCCYVGQWSAQLAWHAQRLGLLCQVDLVDVSRGALDLAQVNCQEWGAESRAYCLDVLQLDKNNELLDEYDVVICDPPAFVKKKSDLSAGLTAYTRLNQLAVQRLAAHGLFVSGSCSGHVGFEQMLEILRPLRRRSGSSLRWLYQGGHGPDHPLRLEFPEGRYLKCFIGYGV